MSLYAQYTQFIAQDGKGDALIEVLMKSNHIISKSDGCRSFVINKEAGNSDSIWLTELWENSEQQVISRSLDGAKELATETDLLLAQPPRQIILEPIAGKDIDN